MERRASISLITGSVQTRDAIYNQLRQYLPQGITINSFALDDIDKIPNFGDVVLFSSHLVKKELEEDWQCPIPADCQVILAERTINYEFIDRIVLLSPGTKVLFVNDAKESAQEGIRALREVGVDHLQFYPYYPSLSEKEKEILLKDIDIAITPGEMNIILKDIPKIYDIGARLLDFMTIVKVLKALGQLENTARHFSNQYIQRIIGLAKKLSHSTNQILELNNHLTTVIAGLKDGLIVYDSQGIINVHNENFRRIMGIPEADLRGVRVKDAIFNRKLVEFLMDDDLGSEHASNINGEKIFISKFKLTDNKYYVARFCRDCDSPYYKENKNIKKGHYAKYTFENLVGKSLVIQKTKAIAQKLSQTDITILLHGESGTGKELFASAIHNQSPMKEAPFLAVNFSALSDDLIESELFGYEPGAFTGALKNGKLGLFEQANGGTIFLDEIGDCSLKVQAKLLRVLQEKEIMRIGDTKIRPINVRIIAATNQNLRELISQGRFREDLYYRLKMGYIKIPPLRERKEDIKELLYQLIQIETTEKIQVEANVICQLENHHWPGNVRELKNLVCYMLALRDGDVLTIKDIPHQEFFEQATIKKPNSVEVVQDGHEVNSCNLPNVDYLVLSAISNLNKQGKCAGRRSVAEFLKKSSDPLSEGQVRTILDKLERQQLIFKNKGKGSKLSSKAKAILG